MLQDVQNLSSGQALDPHYLGHVVDSRMHGL